jgi:hypothetical protein
LFRSRSPGHGTGVDAGSADYLADTRFLADTIDRVTIGKQAVLERASC